MRKGRGPRSRSTQVSVVLMSPFFSELRTTSAWVLIVMVFNMLSETRAT